MSTCSAIDLNIPITLSEEQKKLEELKKLTEQEREQDQIEKEKKNKRIRRITKYFKTKR